jgi:hypothetical protein
VIPGPNSGRRAAVALTLTAIAIAIASGCAPATPTPPATAPAGSGLAAPPSVAIASSPGPSGAAAASPLVAIDPALLDLLPKTIGSIPVMPSPEAAAEPASDPSLAASAQSLAVALAVDQATGNLVVASVVKLKPGVFSDAFFRDWRDSFDQGVCGQAGGVSGNAQATMDGRTVYIGTCEGGVHTYHVHLDGPDVIISANSVGDGRLGEQLMDSLPD